MKNSISLIVSREYLERVKRKSFIITTLLMPILMLGMMVLPGLITALSGPQEQTIAVIDDSGAIAPRLQNDSEVKFVAIDTDMASAKENSDYDAILTIGQQVISDPDGNVSLYTHGAPSIQTETYIKNQLERIIEDVRIRSYNIENLAQILNEVNVDLSLQTFRIDKEEESATSSTLSYLLGMAMMLTLYMFILLYGQMVMTSIIEEKNNRVLELIVSSVKPSRLMLGKILGIGAVAFTQIMIWVVILLACTLWVMPGVIAMAQDSGDATIINALAQLGNPAFMIQLLVWLIVFLVGGYLFYSSIFASIGSAVDNIQDASQIQSLAIIPILAAFVVSMIVVNNPNSTLAFWASIIPFTSPMVMMARMPFGIDWWQIVISALMLYASFIGMIFLAAKIYRVGIFMYGKKPSIGELIRWMHYK